MATVEEHQTMQLVQSACKKYLSHEINWDKVRVQAAIHALDIAARSALVPIFHTDEIVHNAVKLADALIKELQENK